MSFLVVIGGYSSTLPAGRIAACTNITIVSHLLFLLENAGADVERSGVGWDEIYYSEMQVSYIPAIRPLPESYM